MDTIRERFVDGTEAGDKSRMLVWAGSGVGLMRDILPARVRLLKCANFFFIHIMTGNHQATSSRVSAMLKKRSLVDSALDSGMIRHQHGYALSRNMSIRQSQKTVI